MLKQNELDQIKDILSKSNNPLYFFDDDGDGTAAYLILKKYFKKGHGVAIKSGGENGIDYSYLRYVENERPDLVVILDRPIITQEFRDKIPCDVLILDHHPILELKRVFYFNPLKYNKDIYIPTSYLVYSVTKTDLWLAVIGCVFDHMIPDFLKDFVEEYPDILDKVNKDPSYLSYETKLAMFVKLITFNIKGKTSDVKKSLDALENIESPYEILNQTTKYGTLVYKRYEKLNKEYEFILNKIKEYYDKKDPLLLYIYPSGRMSFTRELANELSYLYKDKTIIICRDKEGTIKMSLRDQNKDIAKLMPIALEGLDGYGGGHPHACGGSINKKDFDIFIERMRSLLK